MNSRICVPSPRNGVAGKRVADVQGLAVEWHPSRNAPAVPSGITAGSNKKAWWLCASGHEFQASPNARTNNGRATGRITPCPGCRVEKGGLEFWSWERIVTTAQQVVAREGFLPPAAYFQRNGKSMLTYGVYRHGKTWSELRSAVGSFEGSTFVESRSGQRWLSHAEASLSNFLHARAIAHQKGRRYPPEYEVLSGRRSGFYDLHFRAAGGEEIDVEVWGDKPHPDSEQKYAETRRLKEAFHGGRSNFLGIHHFDCHSDARLEQILLPFIGAVAPHVFAEPHDHVIESSHWSNADELLVTCREIANAQPTGKFPSEDWLRKRGKFANRPGSAYNTVAVYVKTWLGGTRQTRMLLGQASNSTVKWDREAALAQLKGWFEHYGKSPVSVHRDPRIIGEERQAA